MGPAQAVARCFRLYATFSGRAARPEYWWFMLFIVLAPIAANVVDFSLFRLTGSPIFRPAGIQTVPVAPATQPQAASPDNAAPPAANALTTVALGSGIVADVVELALVIPAYAVGARRLHDVDRSGWWLLLLLLPVVGWLILLFWSCRRGTSGSNRFGPPADDRTLPGSRAAFS